MAGAQDQPHDLVPIGELIMIRLLQRLADVLVGEGGTAPRGANSLQTDGTSSSRWDEALTACLYDENARRYLDYMGPRQ